MCECRTDRVGWLNIPVNDAMRMGKSLRIGKLHENASVLRAPRRSRDEPS